MKNNLLRKALVYLLAAVLLVSISVGATIAYFTDSEGVTNTFTVGKVAISMDEAAVNPDGTPIENAARVTSNEYHLIPGKTYTKDPTIYTDSDSEACWLFVKVENGIKTIETTETGKTIEEQMAGNNWVQVEGDYYAYMMQVPGGAKIPVFQTFTIAGDGVDNDDIAAYENASVNVTAYAIQAAGFDTYADAWAALKTQAKLGATTGGDTGESAGQ